MDTNKANEEEMLSSSRFLNDTDPWDKSPVDVATRRNEKTM